MIITTCCFISSLRWYRGFGCFVRRDLEHTVKQFCSYSVALLHRFGTASNSGKVYLVMKYKNTALWLPSNMKYFSPSSSVPWAGKQNVTYLCVRGSSVCVCNNSSHGQSVWEERLKRPPDFTLGMVTWASACPVPPLVWLSNEAAGWHDVCAESLACQPAAEQNVQHWVSGCCPEHSQPMFISNQAAVRFHKMRGNFTLLPETSVLLPGTSIGVSVGVKVTMVLSIARDDRISWGNET